jgi:hypothetical protein
MRKINLFATLSLPILLMAVAPFSGTHVGFGANTAFAQTAPDEGGPDGVDVEGGPDVGGPDTAPGVED